MSDLTTERSNLREYLGDGAADRLVRGEHVHAHAPNTTAVRNGAKVYYLREKNIVTGSVLVNVDRTGFVSFPGAGEAIDLPTGELTFTDTSKPQKTLQANYVWQQFTDAALDSFLTAAIQWLELFGTDLTTSVAGLASGLLPAMKHYAAGEANNQLYSRHAELYDAARGGAQASKSTVPERLKARAEEEFKVAAQFRDDFWGRGGKKHRPYSVRSARRYPSNIPRR